MASFDWSDLRIFLAIHRGRSVRAAALALGVSHSTVSRRLAMIERDLGAKLFTRLSNGLFPTEAGTAIMTYAEKIEAETVKIERDIQGRDGAIAGPIRISMPPPFVHDFMMPHLADFACKYPHIQLELIATYGIADLARSSADIAIRFQSAPDDFLVGRQLPDFASSLYATPAYIESHSFSGPSPSARWIGWGDSAIKPDFQQIEVIESCATEHIASDPMGQLAAAKAGLGFAYNLCVIADREPALRRIPNAGLYKERSAWVLTHPDLITSDRVRICVRFLVKAFQSHQSLISGDCPQPVDA